jgi:hypothetical protein
MKTLNLLCTVALAAGLTTSAVGAERQAQRAGSDAEKLGTVHFTTSCSPAAQAQFERALSILHSFWYEEALKAFSGVVATDPSCAMGYWGIAMSYWHPLWEPPNAAALQKGAEAVGKAQSLPIRTDRERDYVAAIASFYKDDDTVGNAARALVYEKAMEHVYARYTDDREAAIFYALALDTTAPPTDKTYANQKKAGAILEKIFVEQPNHPGVAHYLIHSYDYPPLAQEGLAAAREYAKIAPSVPHALHMPSHTFTRLGLWEESIQTNTASIAVAREYARRNFPGAAISEQLHAMDYLEYAYLQSGRFDAAKQVIDELATIEKAQPEILASGFTFAVTPARYVVERHRWAEAAALTLLPASFPWDRYPFVPGITHFARALGAAHSGQVTAAQTEVEQLRALHERLVASKVGYWADQVEILRLEAAAWSAHAAGDDDSAITQMRSAVQLEDATEKHPVTPGAIVPAHELLADLLVELHQPQLALHEYESSLIGAPNRFNALYGAAHAAVLSGDDRKARSMYAKLVSVCPNADEHGAEIARAKAYLKTASGR